MRTDDSDLILARPSALPSLQPPSESKLAAPTRAEAAVELLIRCGDPWGQRWLDREDFRSYIWVGPSLSHPKVLMAAIEWDRLGDTDLAGSSSARHARNRPGNRWGSDLRRTAQPCRS